MCACVDVFLRSAFLCARAHTRVACACGQALATCTSYFPSPPRPSIPLHPSVRPFVPCYSPTLFPNMHPSLPPSSALRPTLGPSVPSSIPPHARICARARAHPHTNRRAASATSTTPSTPCSASWPTARPRWVSTCSTTKGGSAQETRIAVDVAQLLMFGPKKP